MEYKTVVEGKGGIVARIVADSISLEGKRITTFEGEVHRSVWAEMMTHRLFSRNAMSSRAVPISKMIENTKAVPIKFGAKKAGMVAGEEHDARVTIDGRSLNKKDAWETWAKVNRKIANAFDDAGYHKGDINRPLEAFQMMKFVITATEFDNFFWLRKDEAAKEEIRELADCMYEALQINTPKLLHNDEYHVPYVDFNENAKGDPEYSVNGVIVSVEEALAISSSCCAQVSYREINNNYDKALDVYGKLGVGSGKLHASPFEHPACPMKKSNISFSEIGDLDEDQWTHIDKSGDLWSGNFKGWVQHRQGLDNHVCTDYEAAIK